MSDKSTDDQNTSQPTPLTSGQPAAPPAQYVENPGATAGIIGIVLNLFGIAIGGIILGIISRSQSKAANMPTTLGMISLIWGIIVTVVVTLVVCLAVVLLLVGAIASSEGEPTGPTSQQFETSQLRSI